MSCVDDYIGKFAALLFDLDGTLVDTMPLHYKSYAQVLAQRGLKLSETDFMANIGAPARKAIPSFLEAAGMRAASAADVAAIHAEKKRAFERFLAEDPPVPLAAAALLDAGRGRKKLALVSSGNREGVMALLAAMRWNNVFDVVISGDDVARGKPDPEPYLAAAAALNVAPRDCLVLEDTEAGFASGRAAGMTVLDVSKLPAVE
jgi:HAD superfamily hydrolase (TIGR01509 family)